MDPAWKPEQRHWMTWDRGKLQLVVPAEAATWIINEAIQEPSTGEPWA
jgi:hypothetical protein